jgi:hypothetical protein
MTDGTSSVNDRNLQLQQEWVSDEEMAPTPVSPS